MSIWDYALATVFIVALVGASLISGLCALKATGCL